MRKIDVLFVGLIIMLLGTSCSQIHFISNKDYRAKVNKALAQKRAVMPNGSFGGFSDVFNRKLPLQEKEAMEFLYAYMSLADITNYPDTFFLKNVSLSFQAKQEMPWGKEISEELFRHFVLPLRVNNETLDNSREVFYGELKNRVKNLSLYDAILEVNHWCHEKVVYTPSDARTSSPLASVRTAYGRCGEESTFLVAALRSVGIPARQVYTPRWAHTDDNHAWVEAWSNGKWYFLGACEPEPMLNLAWFTAPAKRGMLMHTNVFGLYTGKEEIMTVTPNFTEINVIGNYAPTDRIDVTILDAQKKPVQGATVEYKLYNYGEFYSVAKKQTDNYGKSFLTSGKGDIIVWASKDGAYDFQKVSVGKDHSLTLTLDKKVSSIADADADAVREMALDLVPPVEMPVTTNVSKEQRAANNLRLAKEDSIRNAYIATFINEDKIKEVAGRLNIDQERAKKLFVASRGNWMEIEKFLLATTAENREKALSLLEVISAKDLRDTPAEVLTDHLLYTIAGQGDVYNHYVLNPRVGDEFLTAYKRNLQNAFSADLANSIRNNPKTLVDWCRKNITINDELNSNRLYMSPFGVWQLRVADTRSRNVFFVAVLRSLGVPSRIELMTGKLQYYFNDSWMDVNFENTEKENAPQGFLSATYTPNSSLKDPLYYKHFTISRIENGKLYLLEFDEDAESSWSKIFSSPLKLDAGNYLMVTGSRMADGSVLSDLSFFTIETGKTTDVQLKMREASGKLQVLGNFNSEATFTDAATGKEQSFLGANGRGYFIAALVRNNHEPTNHALRDIAACKKQLEEWGKQIIILFPDEEEWKAFNPKAYGELPKNITFGIDKNGSVLRQVKDGVETLRQGELPVVIVSDTFNRVVFASQGYRIGLGEQLVKVIEQIQPAQSNGNGCTPAQACSK
ncbi:transglutaminase-like domain-containing protein [uncultured Bacteroides sp.]|uniref:transglutaminase domain-containing protein n=1 Tax=uncultured Bacteroides sp. TaxID=162156 RepID=UPI002AAAA325|nr:transglutaminase-like domain-containing protein [uncultured Bacteroides sp.]